MSSKELLVHVHPLLKVTQTRVYWYDQVQKVSRKGQLQTRSFAVTSVGIFLLEKRVFPRALVMSRCISYCDLLLIRVGETTMSFYAPRITIELQHENHAQVAAIVYSTRQSLFGNNPRPPKLDIIKKFEHEFHTYDFVFESKSLLADRFLSLCLHLPSQFLISDQLSDIYDQLAQSSVCVQIDAETVASQLITPLCDAIAYDCEIHTMKLRKLNLSTLLPSLECILRCNCDLRTIQFFSVSFLGKSHILREIFEKKIPFKATQFHFFDCELTTPDYINVIEAFNYYENKIEAAKFERCTFSEASLQATLKVLSSAECFKYLTELTFTMVKLSDLFQGLIQSLALDSLKSLGLINCGLALDTILPTLALQFPAIRTVDLSGNAVKSPKSVETINFGEIEELNLSECLFSGSSLVSLLKSMSIARNAPEKLSLDGLKIDEAGVFEFFSEIPALFVPSLTSLTWSRNQMKPAQARDFTSFLRRNPQIIDLTLSSSFLPIDLDKTIGYFSNLFETREIQRLVIRGSGTQIYGSKLCPLLSALTKGATICSLDVSSQGIGDSGLEILGALADLCLEELYYDGSAPDSLDSLIKFTGRLANSSLRIAPWPNQDARAAIAKVPLTQRGEATRRTEMARRVYRSRFDLPFEASEDSFYTPTRRDSLAVRPRGASLVRTDSSQAMLIPRLEKDVLSYRDTIIHDFLRECLYSNSESVIPEPLVTELDRINEDTSIDAFLRKIKQ